MALATMRPFDLHLGKGQGQNLLAQSVARGVVNNMEFMLSDLQGIMGDIQSLVAHIDSMTCRSGRRARRNRGQEQQDGQEHKENDPNEACQRKLGRKRSQDLKQKSPKPGESSTSVSSASQHCNQQPQGADSSEKPCGPGESELTGHVQRVDLQRPKHRRNKQENISKHLSDSVLQEVITNPIKDPRINKKRASAWFASPNTILDTGSTKEDADKEQSDVNPRNFDQCETHQDDDRSGTQSKDFSLEPLSGLGSASPGRPIYKHPERDDSLASRGEYDLETLEATLGNRADFSDGDQSRLSLEDSPLRLRYANKSKREFMPSSGSVAIVHPFVNTKPNKQSPKDIQSSTYDDIEYYGRHRVCKAAFSPKQVYHISVAGQINNIPDEYEIPISNCLKGNESVKKTRQTYVYNKAFLPITPTEQNSLSALHKCLEPGDLSGSNKLVHYDSVYASTGDFVHPLNSLNPSSLPNSPKVKRTVRVGFGFDSFDSNQNRLQTRPVYARIEGSPASTRSSSSTVRKPVAHHYYYSIDSDLDSDILPEYLDPRGLTPDLDWSYLNLVGSDLLGSIMHVEGKGNINVAYESPVPRIGDQQRFDISQLSPSGVPAVPFYHVLTSKQSSSPSDSSSDNKKPASDLYEEPTASLLTCCGAKDTNEYCGCYEAHLDSILENVAGFETFEEALESLTCEDILNETYTNFDDQFEEDDWDVGFDSGDMSGFAIDCHFMDLEDKNDGAISDFFSEKSFDIATVSSSRSVNRPCVLSLSKKFIPNTAGRDSKEIYETSLKSKRKSPPDYAPGRDIIESKDIVFKQKTGDTSMSLSHRSQDHQTDFIASTPWTKSSIDSLTDELKSNDIKSPVDSENDSCPGVMTISYDTSCRAVASDSPMSLCSSDAAETSPVSDRFITSSEGDDLFTSHDESSFLLSPASPGSVTVDNARAGQTFGRTKASELTQQFLLSLRDICDRYSNADGVGSSSSGNDEENGENINKSRDSSSSALNSNNSSTITASTSTATNATLTDDNSQDNDNPCTDNAISTVSEVDDNSYNDDTITGGGYNRNVNTWTAYAVVHVQADDVSDGTSSDVIINDNILGSMYTMTASHLSNDNVDGGLF